MHVAIINYHVTTQVMELWGDFQKQAGDISEIRVQWGRKLASVHASAIGSWRMQLTQVTFEKWTLMARMRRRGAAIQPQR